MILYPRTPSRAAAHAIGDVGLLVWIIAWVLIGRWVTRLVAALGQPAVEMAQAGTGYTSVMQSTSERVKDVPVVGGALQEAFSRAAAPGGNVSSAATNLAQTIDTLSVALGASVALAPIACALLAWVLVRGRFIRRAGAAVDVLRTAEDVDLFALRALVNQPVDVLAKISSDPAGGYRRGDPAIVAALADLELADLGVISRPGVPAGGALRRRGQ